MQRWGLGPLGAEGGEEAVKSLHDAWYQPFRHDIIGNTLSADLIDYLRRDPQRLGLNRQIELKLLDHYVLVRVAEKDIGASQLDWNGANRPKRELYRCAIDLYDNKRGTSRLSLLNDLFRLLDLRHEIHEKAVMHRVVQAAIAMLARALMLLAEKAPSLDEMTKIGEPEHALQGDEVFFRELLLRCGVPNATVNPHVRDAFELLRKLIDRRVYRPLMIIPGHRAAEFHWDGHRQDPEQHLRTLATLIDCAYFSPFLLFVSYCIEKYLQGILDDVCEFAARIHKNDQAAMDAMELLPSRVIIWTTPYKQLYKDPGVFVALEDNTSCRIDELAEHPTEHDEWLKKLVRTSLQDTDSKYDGLWKIYVFITDSLFYTGILGKLKNKASIGQASEKVGHEDRLRKAQAFVVAALKSICGAWHELTTKHNSASELEIQLRAYPNNP